MAMAKDHSVLLGLARQWDQNAKTRTGRVLSYDNFDEGFGRWADHYSGTPRNPLSLTSERALSGKRSLMISAASGYPFGDASPWLHNVSGTYNRMTRFFTERYVDFSCIYAFGGTDSMAVGSFFMYLDTQVWGQASPTRSFFTLRSNPSSNTGIRTWGIRGNGGASDIITIPSSGGTYGLATQGYNENKLNQGYMRLTVDLQANGGLGGYVECQLNHLTYNLTTVGAGSATEPPQIVAGDEDQSFAGGFNPGFGMGTTVPGTNSQIAGEAWLILDEVAVSVRSA